MANLTTAGIHTLTLTDGTTYTVEVRVDEAALAEALGRKALHNRSGVAKEVGGLVQVRTVDASAARARLDASRDAGRTWEATYDVWRERWRTERGLDYYSADWPAMSKAEYAAADLAWRAANPKPARVTWPGVPPTPSQPA